MALILCPECLSQVAGQAPRCSNCGCPIAERSSGNSKLPRYEECWFSIMLSDRPGEPKCAIEVHIRGPEGEKIAQTVTVHEGINWFGFNNQARQKTLDQLSAEYVIKGWQLVKTIESSGIKHPTFKRKSEQVGFASAF